MRFVSLDSLEEGMVLGKKLIGKNNELLLNSGTVIESSYIKKIAEHGFMGIYIQDDLSDEIEIPDVIDEKLRSEAVVTVKDAFMKLDPDKRETLKHVDKISNIVNSIIDNILQNTDVMVNMIDLKYFDDYTFFHCVNVSILALVLGKASGLNKYQLYKLGLASVLHDVGKMFIPKEVLNKNGKLTDDEFEIIKTHPQKGYDLLRKCYNVPSVSCVSILHHHEKFNGEGYPTKTAGDKIHHFSRIISVVDVYDALTSRRPYRKAIPASEAIEYIMGSGGTHFDPAVVGIFCKKIPPFPTGTTILLSDGKVGLVVENYEDCCTRPKVKIFKHNDEKVTPYYINLKEDKEYRDVIIKGLA